MLEMRTECLVCHSELTNLSMQKFARMSVPTAQTAQPT